MFDRTYQGRTGERERQSLLSAIRQQDTQVHFTGIRSTEDLLLSRELEGDYVEGAFLETEYHTTRDFRRFAKGI